MRSLEERAHPRGFGSLSPGAALVRQRKKLLTLEQMIHKMTGLPAQRLFLQNKGRIEEGLDADLAVFDWPVLQDTSDYIHSNTVARGMEYVVVAGQVVYEKGRLTGAAPGRIPAAPPGWIRDRRDGNEPQCGQPGTDQADQPASSFWIRSGGTAHQPGAHCPGAFTEQNHGERHLRRSAGPAHDRELGGKGPEKGAAALPKCWGFNPRSACGVGIDLHTENAMAVVTDINGEVLYRQESAGGLTARHHARLAMEVVQHSGMPVEDTIALGVSVPGTVTQEGW